MTLHECPTWQGSTTKGRRSHAGLSTSATPFVAEVHNLADWSVRQRNQCSAQGKLDGRNRGCLDGWNYCREATFESIQGGADVQPYRVFIVFESFCFCLLLTRVQRASLVCVTAGAPPLLVRAPTRFFKVTTAHHLNIYDQPSIDMAHQDKSAMFARHFIDERGPGIHDVFSVESHFNTSTSIYESKEVQ
jgi:hypothetical protein